MAGPAGGTEVLIPMVVTVVDMVHVSSSAGTAWPCQLAAMMVTAHDAASNGGPVRR